MREHHGIWKQFVGEFSGYKNVCDEFQIPLKQLNEYEVLVAAYIYGDYEGYAFLLLRKDEKLYEVHASHCSCYGLEGQFEPEETTSQALMYRLANGFIYEYEPLANPDVILCMVYTDMFDRNICLEGKLKSRKENDNGQETNN